ncbi:radical SAM family heme chaperone HemW [Solemya elarraichensis gill symbiont]|uniref:radical SAM family heme chaperone HemW n=1 Tax=Solemya elarraichensis gill symbiont TaxID=1918949 RepID=UPI001FE5E51C|nr:radical SAM family heme chaperone HemW [Solemya elarraichensis gill symbiont]
MLQADTIPLSLYIHMPWCVRKCPYCDFNSHAAGNIEEEAYIDALLQDFDGELELPGVRNRGITSIFIGGGTPSLFSADAIKRLLSGIAQRAVCGAAEVTLEANPGSADSSKFAGYREAGVNRLSIGIQSFDDAKLAVLGRIHNRETAMQAIEKARIAGFDNLNLDLMYGLPEQSEDEAMLDLQQAISFQPEHLSWYQLTLEPNTPFHHSPPAGLADNDQLADLSARGIEQLQQAGYSQYEVSAYAQPGKACRHNLNYWQFGDYLGIGAGAHAKITLKDGTIVRRHKQRHPQRYLASVTAADALSSSRVLTEDDLRLEFMMSALRLNAGFRQQDYELRTGLAFSSIEETLGEQVKKGLLERSGDSWRASESGRLHLDSLLLDFS